MMEIFNIVLQLKTKKTIRVEFKLDQKQLKYGIKSYC